jgi:hypothetical protein
VQPAIQVQNGQHTPVVKSIILQSYPVWRCPDAVRSIEAPRVHHASERRDNGFFVWIFILVPIGSYKRPMDLKSSNAVSEHGPQLFARLVWISQQIKKMRENIILAGDLAPL